MKEYFYFEYLPQFSTSSFYFCFRTHVRTCTHIHIYMNTLHYFVSDLITNLFNFNSIYGLFINVLHLCMYYLLMIKTYSEARETNVSKM